jgi:short-subunit dehydrogenase
MAERLCGKVAVITGASMGIGEAIARLFVEEGASVVLTSRDAARAEAARGRLGRPEQTLALHCDVRNREEIVRVLSLTLHNFGRVDIWVNNAGHGLIDSVALMDMAQCRSMFDTNLFGALEAMQIVIPVMKEQGGGAIINISSVAGHVPLPYSAAYSGTKFALNAMGKAANVELKGSGVRVITVCPGYIATDFGRNAIKGTDRQRFSQAGRRGAGAGQVARATLDGYLKAKREVVVPWYYHVAIKFYQLFPGMVEWFMARMLRPADQVIAEAEAARKQ